MIPILRVLVLTVFLFLAFVLACRKEQHHSTYRLILAFVAVGATTFFPEDNVMIQVVFGVSTFFFLSVLVQLFVRSRTLAEKEEDEKAKKHNV